MDAILSGSSLASSVLSGLDIVAATHAGGNNLSYPNGAKYGVVTSGAGMVIPVPVCIKVGIPGNIRLCGYSGAGESFRVDYVHITTGPSDYNTNSAAVSITWFG